MATALSSTLASRLLRVTIALSCLVVLLETLYGATNYEGRSKSWRKQPIAQLSIDEKIGQMLQIRVYGDYGDFSDPAYLYVRDKIRRFHIGSVILGGRMAGANLSKGTPVQAATILNQFQRDSAIPMLVGSDLERSLASRLSATAEFPYPMAFGAIGDPEMVARFGATTAQQARAVGIHWAYTPTADVNNNPANPIINTRSFSEDPDEVSRFVAAYIRGAHASGMIVTAKHFPGHGDSATDSHVAGVRINASREHLNKYELPPFMAAISAGVDSIMLAHASVPALDSDPRRIATTSPKIVNGVLKGELGFKGLVVTDALEMRALTALYPKDPNPSGRAAVEAIKAGADIIMMPEDVEGVFNAILAAVRSGEIPESRIDESVHKVLELKASLGLDKNRFVDLNKVAELFNQSEAKLFAQEVSDKSITLVRGNGRVLPLQISPKTPRNLVQPAWTNSLVVISSGDSQFSRLGREFDKEIKSRRPDAKIFHLYNDGIGSANPSDVMAAVSTADQVVVAAFVTHVPGRQIVQNGRVVVPVGLMGASAKLLGEVVAKNAEKTVVVALGSPYLIQSFPEIQNYVCTYSLARTAEVSTARALFGEIQNTAKLPITIPGVAQRGFSIPWPQVSAK